MKLLIVNKEHWITLVTLHFGTSDTIISLSNYFKPYPYDDRCNNNVLFIFIIQHNVQISVDECELHEKEVTHYSDTFNAG